MRTRVFYLCRTNSLLDQARYGEHLHIGPAYQKLINVLTALRVAGAKVVLATVPVGKTDRHIPLRKTIAGRERGLLLCSFGLAGSKLANRLHASLSFLRLAVYANRCDILILYNFFPEYIPAAVYRSLLNSPCILDIEDAPRTDERTVQGFVGRISFKILTFLCSKRTLTVSHTVGKAFALQDYMPVYGAVPDASPGILSLEKWTGQSEKLRVIYGGSLLPETGVDHFCAFLDELALSPRLAGIVTVLVTGFGEIHKVRKRKELLKGTDLDICIMEDLPFDEYTNLLDSAHVGLCLKIPGTQMGDTTFPSKVVEFIRSRLLVVTTPVSDVPEIFESTTRTPGAVIIRGDYSSSLVSAIGWIIDNRADAIKIGRRGQEIALNKFSAMRVGTSVLGHIGYKSSTADRNA